MKKNKIDVIWGAATIAAAGKVSGRRRADNPPKGALGGGDYEAKHIIVATGARPRALPGLEPDQKLIWTYFEAMVPEKMPKSLLVVGSGAIGIEFASFYRTHGRRGDGRRDPAADPAGRGRGDRRPRPQALREGRASASSPTPRSPSSRRARTASPRRSRRRTARREEIKVDRVISAVGVVGNIENLGLEKLGVKIERGSSSSTASAGPTCPASTPSATSPDRRCSPTRRSTRASSASRRSPASTRTRWTS